MRFPCSAIRLMNHSFDFFNWIIWHLRSAFSFSRALDLISGNECRDWSDLLCILLMLWDFWDSES